MKRRLLAILSAFSLLLCVAVVVMWVRSVAFSTDCLIDADEVVGIDGHYHARAFWSQGGYVWVFTRRERTNMMVGRGSDGKWSHPPPQRPRWLDYPERRAPFAAGYLRRKARSYDVELADERYWWVHYSTLALLTSSLPLWYVWGLRKRGGADRTGTCRCCGYDLRASPDLCPECGVVP